VIKNRTLKIISKLSVPFGDIELKTKWAYWPVLAATGKNIEIYSEKIRVILSVFLWNVMIINGK
jgi:hypothetical protein